MFYITETTGVKIRKGVFKRLFYVVLVGANSKVLSVTETFNTKQAAWKNIEAQARAANTVYVAVHLTAQDDTLPKPKRYICVVLSESLHRSETEPGPRYQPGRNKKLKGY